MFYIGKLYSFNVKQGCTWFRKSGGEGVIAPSPSPANYCPVKKISYNFSFGDNKKRDRRLGIKLLESEASTNPIKAERL